MGGLPTADGRRIRNGIVFRAGHFGTATDADVARLDQMGLGAVLDVRTQPEIEHDGSDRLPGDARYQNIPIGGDDGNDGGVIATALRTGNAQLLVEAFSDGRAVEFGRMSQVAMIDHPQMRLACRFALEAAADPHHHALVVHCTAGKDRTGFICTMIAAAVGVVPAAIEAAYVASNIHRPVQQRVDYFTERVGAEVAEMMRPVIEVRAEYLWNGLQEITKRYGSVQQYLQEWLGVDRAMTEQLKASLLSPTE